MDKKQKSASIEEPNTKLKIKIQNSREKLKQIFHNDPRGDFEIITKRKKYKLQKAHLRLFSPYFAELFKGDTKSIEIKQFNESPMQNVLSLFYGHTIEMPMNQVDEYYQILKKFQLDSIAASIIKDIYNSPEHYNVFKVLNIAIKYSDRQLYDWCFEELKKQNYEQFNYQQLDLFDADLKLFRLLMKSLSQSKKKNNEQCLSFVQIDKLIKGYCQFNSLDNTILEDLKKEFVDVEALNSQQYKQIFLDQVSDNAQYPSYQNQLQHSINGFTSQTIQLKNNKQKKLQIQYNFQRKKNQQLTAQNKTLKRQLKELRMSAKISVQMQAKLQGQLYNIKLQVQKKQIIIRQQTIRINRLQQLLQKMKQKDVQLDRLTAKLQMQKKQRIELQKKINKKHNSSCDSSYSHHSLNQQKEQQEEDDRHYEQNNFVVQSQFLPAHLLMDIMGSQIPSSSSPVKKKSQEPKKQDKNLKISQKKNVIQAKDTEQQQQSIKQLIQYEELDEQQLEQIYQDRIKFDEEPVSVGKKYLPFLSIFLTTEGFSKKSLSLIYRRSKTSPAKGEIQHIRNKDQLLFLTNNQYGQQIGGFISQRLTTNKTSIKDHQAFIFNLNKNKRFKVDPDKSGSAIQISNSNLIAFSSDLIISKQTLTQKSYCYWPKSYVFGKKGNKDMVWFAGASQFYITDIEVYQVSQAEMQMIL